MRHRVDVPTTSARARHSSPAVLSNQLMGASETSMAWWRFSTTLAPFVAHEQPDQGPGEGDLLRGDQRPYPGVDGGGLRRIEVNVQLGAARILGVQLIGLPDENRVDLRHDRPVPGRSWLGQVGADNG